MEAGASILGHIGAISDIMMVPAGCSCYNPFWSWWGGSWCEFLPGERVTGVKWEKSEGGKDSVKLA